MTALDLQCESNHLKKPKEICNVCGTKACGHCDEDPLKVFNKTWCPHCLKNMSEE